MCGIFGFSLKRKLTQLDIELGKSGVKALNYRGPDNSDYWIDEANGIFMGHARLATLDLTSDSNQPMRINESVITYNGEIYNYKEVRNKLISEGIQFHSNGDVEVLLQAWRKWGDKCFDELDGMFAFSIYNGHELFLATDCFGEKPLYWATTNEGFYFSSESSPLVNLLRLETYFSENDIADYLFHGYLSAPATGYKNLYRAHPAILMQVVCGEIVQQKTFWRPPQSYIGKGILKPITESELDEINNCLIQSVKVRLHSDAPLALFLSAGVDSSLVASIAAKELNSNITTLTVKFSDSEVQDESGQAMAIASSLKLPNIIIDSNDDHKNNLKHLCSLLGEANDNVTAGAIYQISKVAVTKVKVAITGLGGDELFYGYQRYHVLNSLNPLLKLPFNLKQIISKILSFSKKEKWKIIREIISAPITLQYHAVKNGLYFDWLRNCCSVESVDAIDKSAFKSHIPMVFMARDYDLSNTLPYTFIHAMDRASMRAGLEIRTPYLNKALLSVIAKMDQRAFVSFGHKNILIRLLKRYLPDHLISSRKQGFNYPMKQILNYNPIKPRLTGYLKDEYINVAWSKRDLNGWSRLCLRLKIMETFCNMDQNPILELN